MLGIALFGFFPAYLASNLLKISIDCGGGGGAGMCVYSLGVVVFGKEERDMI